MTPLYIYMSTVKDEQYAHKLTKITVAYWIIIITPHFILSSSKELTSWVKLQVEIVCKASRKRALQKICTCSLTHDVSSLEDDNVFVFCVSFF